jgi:hypothetical protein
VKATRREVLRTLGVYLAGLPIVSACGGPEAPPEWRPLAVRAARYFEPEELPAVRKIGARFISLFGVETETLELGPTIDLLDATDPIDDVTVLDEAIVADFVAIETRHVDGWWLSATEAHLCALVERFGITAADVDTE